MSAMESTNKSIVELLRNAPKQLNNDYLRHLHLALSEQTLDNTEDVEDIANSLLLMIMSDDTPSQDRALVVSIFELIPPIPGLSEILSSATITQLINSLPVLLASCMPMEETSDIIRKLSWSVRHDNLTMEEQRSILMFLPKVVYSDNNPLNQEEIKEILDILPNWMRGVISPRVSKAPRFQRSTSTLSMTDVDGNKDIFTLLNYTQLSASDQLLDIQIFSMLRSWLLDPNRNFSQAGKVPFPRLADLISEELSFTVREYCLRMVDQANKKALSPGMAEIQKTCLVEAIALLDVICYADSGIVHSVLATIKGIYKEVSAGILDHRSAKDIAIMVAAMQFFINHGSAVMYKHDSLYPFLFCDLLNVCYQDPVASAEILLLTRKNLAQLCYHSSIMERYFPTFFKVLAWSPSMMTPDFMQILPAFMSQHTSIEIFHTLLDLPCLSAILDIVNYKPDVIEDESYSIEVATFEKLQQPENKPFLNFFLRKSSNMDDVFDRIEDLHILLKPFLSHPRVTACAEACIPLLKCFFSTFHQYADPSCVLLLMRAILERIAVIFQVNDYVEQIQKIFADGIFQLLKKHPVIVFHCKKKIIEQLNHLKNYSVSKECFINLVWAVGEFVSIKYSDFCTPDVITSYFEAIEPTVYEMINALKWTADDSFLKLISTSCSSLAALSVRSQDLMPRAVLCLSKVHSQIMACDNNYKITWRIVEERVMELLNILNTPTIASVVLDPPKDMESGKLHRDATALPFVLRAVTALLDSKS